MGDSYEEISEDVSESMDCEGPLCPPPLRHQRSADMRFDDYSPPMYRSLAMGTCGGSSSSMMDEYEEAPVYRSMAAVSALDLGLGHTLTDHALDAEYGFEPCAGLPSWGAHEPGFAKDFKEPAVYRGLPHRASLSALLNTPPTDAGPSIVPPASFVFELPAELHDLVLNLLTPCPDLFAAMLCSRSWRDAARANYANRCKTVRASPDALLVAIGSAWPGDTLLVAAGYHMLSNEVTVDKPLRLIGAGTDNAVLVSTHHVLLRTRCSAHVQGLTLLRMGEEVGYPNAVVYAEAGPLTMRDCRITCGGSAQGVAHAMRVFDGAPAPGQPWAGAERPGAAAGDVPAQADDRGQDPQSGLWVGAAARVHLSQSMILGCQGPGVKIYRGELEALDNTIAFACRGANVVANGGKVLLLRNEIKGALGDGVSSWNNSQLSVDTNRVHSNSGAGIAINTGGGAVNIRKNLVFDNCCSAVLFATSQTKQATLSDNDLERNTAGGVQGLHQVAGQRFLHQQRRRRSAEAQPLHLQRSAFAPPPLLEADAGPSSSSFPESGASMEM